MALSVRMARSARDRHKSPYSGGAAGEVVAYLCGLGRNYVRATGSRRHEFYGDENHCAGYNSVENGAIVRGTPGGWLWDTGLDDHPT